MPSILVRSATSASNNHPKKKFRTVLGLAAISDDQSLDHLAAPAKRQHRPEGSTVTNASFFDHPNPAPAPTSSVEHMIIDSIPPSSHSARPDPRPLRMDAEDGLWTVSVAENGPDGRSYTIYIKTPTHHLTLTRTAAEIADLHGKLSDANPSTKLPPLPLTLENMPQKRRSSFLNTLSRLASSSKPSALPTPSPTNEASDPFTAAHPTSTTTGLAAYLTSLSNDTTIRTSRVWRRFVRVRTDDLESVRVERAIKRVRSDLAMHAKVEVPSSLTLVSDAASSSEPSLADEKDNGVGSLTRGDILEEEEPKESLPDIPSSPPTDSTHVHAEATPRPSVEPEATPLPPTPTSSPPPEPESVPAAARIPRSASADPDKATRLSRVWKSSPLNPSRTDVETSDAEEAPVSTRRKKKQRKSRKVVIDDFEMMRVLGKGCAGKVLLVRHRASNALYALKAITKRHVLAHQELQHTLTEQAVLKRMAHEAKDPFVVKLWWSFHDRENLFLVMDFHPGGDLATQLARWGRLGRDRARFYAAEIVEGVEGLHKAGVIYRDLKPENILIGADGHIVLTDFGLSKEFPRREALTASRNAAGDFYSSSNSSSTPHWMKGGDSEKDRLVNAWSSQNDMTSTFCGTAEYLAPEVIQGLPYSYQVDWWSFGTMLYEMLTGITPFWANNHSDMYVRVLQDELTFPEDKAMDQDTKSLIRGLLQRNPALRMSEPRIKRHPYFSMIDWGHVYHKRYIPPYIPPIDPSNESDTQNFDDAFLDMDPVIDNEPDPEHTESERERTDGERTDGEDSIRGSDGAGPKPNGISPHAQETVDVFDGYSFKGRNSVLIEDEDDDGYEGPDEEEEELEESKVPKDLLSEAEPELESHQEPRAPETPDETSVDGEKTPEPTRAPLPAIDVEARHPADVPVDVSVSPSPVQSSPTDISTTPTDTTSPDTGSLSTPATELSIENLAAVKAIEDAQITVGPASEVPSEATQPPVVGLGLIDTSSSAALAATPKATTLAELTPEPAIPAGVPTTPTPSFEKELVEDARIAALVEQDVGSQTEATPTVEKTVDSSLITNLVPPTPVATLPTDTAAPAPAATATPVKSSPTKTKTAQVKAGPVKAEPVTPVNVRPIRGRREKSGVAALDRHLSSALDDDEDDDWDLVETPGGDEYNASYHQNRQGKTLFQRGVVDRYRLALAFRKSTSSRPTRSVLGATADSENAEGVASPTPSDKVRRGRSAGLSLRKTKQFLRARSPVGTFTPSSSLNSRATLANSASGSMSTSSGLLLTPSPSVPLPGPPTLKTKSSAVSSTSLTSPGSSDNSINGDSRMISQSQSMAELGVTSTSSPPKTNNGAVLETPKRGGRFSHPDDSERQKNVHLKKMKKNMEERVFSLFSSPREKS